MLRRFLNMIVRKNDVSYRMFFLDRVSDILATLKVLKPKKTFLKTFQTLFQKLVFFQPRSTPPPLTSRVSGSVPLASHAEH